MKHDPTDAIADGKTMQIVYAEWVRDALEDAKNDDKHGGTYGRTER